MLDPGIPEPRILLPSHCIKVQDLRRICKATLSLWDPPGHNACFGQCSLGVYDDYGIPGSVPNSSQDFLLLRGFPV